MSARLLEEIRAIRQEIEELSEMPHEPWCEGGACPCDCQKGDRLREAYARLAETELRSRE